MQQPPEHHRSAFSFTSFRLTLVKIWPERAWAIHILKQRELFIRREWYRRSVPILMSNISPKGLP